MVPSDHTAFAQFFLAKVLYSSANANCNFWCLYVSKDFLTVVHQTSISKCSSKQFFYFQSLCVEGYGVLLLHFGIYRFLYTPYKLLHRHSTKNSLAVCLIFYRQIGIFFGGFGLPPKQRFQPPIKFANAFRHYAEYPQFPCKCFKLRHRSLIQCLTTIKSVLMVNFKFIACLTLILMEYF